MAHIIFDKKLPSIKQLSQILAVEAMKRSKNDRVLAAKKIGISRQYLEMILSGHKIILLENP